jgi:hypothetical protein
MLSYMEMSTIYILPKVYTDHSLFNLNQSESQTINTDPSQTDSHNKINYNYFQLVHISTNDFTIPIHEL